jgi:hypothetical protein
MAHGSAITGRIGEAKCGTALQWQSDVGRSVRPSLRLGIEPLLGLTARFKLKC